MFEPSTAYLVNGSSELDESKPEFDGTSKYRGVNPATGVVMYYQLPALKDSSAIVTMEIKDAAGNVVHTFNSKADSTYKKYDGAPPEEPTLTKEKGLNRFVWNMRHATIPGIPTVYIESSYRGHKAIPGTYTVTLKAGEQQASVKAIILANPLYSTTAAAYTAYNSTMSAMEAEVTGMHKMINTMDAKRSQLVQMLATLSTDEKYAALKTQGAALVKRMKAWDEDMIQRKSTAYDDVENFPNKFSANYMFLLNQSESDIPGINQPALDLLKELNAQWNLLKNKGTDLLSKDIPAFNQTLWQAGVGAIWKN